MSCQEWGCFSKIGPIAKASAGNVNAPAAIAPAECALAVMNLRRVIVSPSKAPGMPLSSVYLDLCLSATAAEQYRGGPTGGAGTRAACALRLDLSRASRIGCEPP